MTSSHTVRATARGPMPGTDPLEASRIVHGELGSPHLPHLIELPDRGVGSDPVGRTAGLLEELHVDLHSYGWRLATRPGRDAGRIAGALRSDINATADVLGAQSEPAAELKLRIVGPLALAKSLYLANGERALSDHGARRDLADSLAVGAARHVDAVRRGTGVERVVVEVDESGLGPVLAGAVPTVSGYRTLRSVPRHEVSAAWRTVAEALRDAGAETVLSTDVDPADVSVVVEALTGAGFDGAGLNVAALDTAAWEQLAGLVEGGRSVWLGLLDPSWLELDVDDRPRLPRVTEMVRRVHRPWRQLGLGDAQLAQAVLMPADGLAGLPPVAVRSVLTALTGTAEALSQIAAEAAA
ncbi:hypothetical protein [Zhihengliuella sp.]|uniref:hypothetical protein n=1 Tax=Zhihengliuella sp. TaxID=1954483 RepID=UPI0028110EA2|nr:hypothetical protein [Zhihengliuella sp.]